jgi:hypothetical protein
MNDFLRGFSISFGLSTLGFAALDLAVSRERAQLLKRSGALQCGVAGRDDGNFLALFFRCTGFFSHCHAGDFRAGVGQIAIG